MVQDRGQVRRVAEDDVSHLDESAQRTGLDSVAPAFGHGLERGAGTQERLARHNSGAARHGEGGDSNRACRRSRLRGDEVTEGATGHADDRDDDDEREHGPCCDDHTLDHGDPTETEIRLGETRLELRPAEEGARLGPAHAQARNGPQDLD